MIISHREALYNVLAHTCKNIGASLFKYLPDGDLGPSPTVVVGRPTITIGGSALGVETTCPVYVIGRRLGDDDSQDQLDSMTEAIVITLLDADIPISTVIPTAQAVGSNTFPTYEIATAHGQTLCRCDDHGKES